ncbi:MAG: GIY-YIG nuclease family protein [Bacteroidaceae bacterium]|nr:GIY-YIG nuclease family protein [Bacteroidaceae bacterium]
MAKTIYTYLYNDDLRGSRIITMDNCFCKLFSICRTDYAFMQQFKEDLEKPALYVLINRSKRRAYIGETDAFLTRLNQHIAKKDFWTEALAFISTDDSLSKTEVQYLESLAYKTAKNAHTYDLSENSIIPKVPHMNYIQKSKSEEFFKFVQYLIKFIGCDVFEKIGNIIKKPISVKTEKTEPIFITDHITADDLTGKIAIILNGKSTNKSRLGVAVVKEYLINHPESTFESLKSVFHNGLLGEWNQWGMLESDIKLAKSLKKETGAYRHHTKTEFVLRSGDGIKFVVSNQWSSVNVMNLIQFIKEEGWTIKIKKEATQHH